jgi:predicted phosphodiesterase
MGRTIIIGDIHGCFDELSDLLARCGAAADDHVVSVGDMLRKGPHPARCVALWRERGYLAVLGNQDARVLEEPFWKRWLADRISRRLLEVVAAWPLFLDLADIGVAVVHAAFCRTATASRPSWCRATSRSPCATCAATAGGGSRYRGERSARAIVSGPSSGAATA